MGIFSFMISAFKFRRKQTTQEKLQHIDEQIECLNESSKLNQQRQIAAIRYLRVFSILIYLTSSFVFYMWYFPVRWDQRLLYSLPFLLFPFIIIGMSRLVHRIYVNRISVNASAVKELKKNKKKILENVMDTETYKVAKELLQKYDPHRSLVEQSETPLKPIQPKTPDGQELRKRNVQSAPVTLSKPSQPKPPPQPHPPATNGYAPITPTSSGPRPLPPPPAPGGAGGVVTNGGPMRVGNGVPMIRGPAHRAPVTIAPILPRERSVFDKVCDYVIGDGPNNRFALICKQCYGHNGMVLTEEFQFTSYRCCYCGFFNPARMKRLSAPKLERPRLQNTRSNTASESPNSTDAESTKADDTVEEKEKLTITEKGEPSSSKREEDEGGDLANKTDTDAGGDNTMKANSTGDADPVDAEEPMEEDDLPVPVGEEETDENKEEIDETGNGELPPVTEESDKES